MNKTVNVGKKLDFTPETFKGLEKAIEEEREIYGKLGIEEGLENASVTIMLYDKDGAIVTGKLRTIVGWVGNEFVMVGDVDTIHFAKEDSEDDVTESKKGVTG